MKRSLVVLVASVLLTTTALVDDTPFDNKAWKKFPESSLNFSIYLPKKFKKSESSLSDFIIYTRKNPHIAVGVFRYAGSIGPMSRADAIEFVEELQNELWLDSSIEYTKVYDPTLITNYAGQNGFHWMFQECGPNLRNYYWTFDTYFDSDGHFYMVICLGDPESSPDVGAGITFCMEHGVMPSLLNPMTEPTDALIAAQKVATAAKIFEKELVSLINKTH